VRNNQGYVKEKERGKESKEIQANLEVIQFAPMGKVKVHPCVQPRVFKDKQ